MRAALATLRYHVHDKPLKPTEVAAHYAAHHAGVPASSRAVPEEAVLYRNVTGSRLPVLLGLYGDENRVRGWLPGLPRHITAETARDLVARAHTPVQAPARHEPLPGVDLTELPALVATPRDAGPYLTTGVIHAAEAMSVHRMLILGPDRLAVWMVPGRLLRALHESAGRLPVTIALGVPPAVMVASALGSRFLPPGVTKAAMAGALAGEPLAIAGRAPAQAEIVLEGALTEERADEALAGEPGTPQRSKSPPGGGLGVSLPEFLGYDGSARPGLPVITVTGMAARRRPIFQAVIGPGREQSIILGLAGALSVALSVPDPIIAGLHYGPAGGGMLTLVVTVRKRGQADDHRLGDLAERIFRAHPFTKLVVFTDDDVDPSCPEDVLWALTTRCNLGVDAITLPGFTPLGMDPSQRPDWSRGGGEGRTYVDATTPYLGRAATRRSFPS
ncbi:UbiD family decarboxylase domain-containing protein [Spongiactinospora sp. 9N601]|uniref:UbiD family decarboxylase domain-containing protein n=1 Tax=Spongiactinospora sp. 9N601 TaxID=3375149 RepID=UPI0037911FA4